MVVVIRLYIAIGWSTEVRESLLRETEAFSEGLFFPSLKVNLNLF